MGRAVADRRAREHRRRAGRRARPRWRAPSSPVLADRRSRSSASTCSAAHRPAVPRPGGAARLLRDRARHVRGAAHHARHAVGQRALRPVRHDPRRRGRLPHPARDRALRRRRSTTSSGTGSRSRSRRCSPASIVAVRGQHGLLRARARRRVVGALDQPRAALPRLARRAGAQLRRRARRRSCSPRAGGAGRRPPTSSSASSSPASRSCCSRRSRPRCCPSSPPSPAPGKHDDFRAGLKKLLMIVVGVGVLGVVAGATIGPTVGQILFGDKFNLEQRRSRRCCSSGSAAVHPRPHARAGADRAPRPRPGADRVGSRARACAWS